ncbi:MAG: hypothetical protein KGN78_13550 [Actinomycetales bacterium]|nr:hypothetical protein [Actinomycetales bacterium]
MPGKVTTPAPTAAVDRLTLSTECVRGTEGAAGEFALVGVCFADDAE